MLNKFTEHYRIVHLFIMIWICLSFKALRYTRMFRLKKIPKKPKPFMTNLPFFENIHNFVHTFSVTPLVYSLSVLINARELSLV